MDTSAYEVIRALVCAVDTPTQAYNNDTVACGWESYDLTPTEYVVIYHDYHDNEYIAFYANDNAVCYFIRDYKGRVAEIEYVDYGDITDAIMQLIDAAEEAEKKAVPGEFICVDDDLYDAVDYIAFDIIDVYCRNS